jgi:hypothetical protein
LKVNIYKKTEKDISQASETSLNSASTISKCSLSKKITRLPFEKILEKHNKLRLKFIPLEACEHIIDISDNEKSIDSKFPQNYLKYFIIKPLFKLYLFIRFSY